MESKFKARQRRTRRTRAKIRELEQNRLSVYRSSNHISAQVISPCGGKVLAAASSVEKDIRSAAKHTGNKDTAALVGKLVAERALKANVKQVAFDRSGYRYHGRVKALADAARDGGIEF